MACPAAIHPKSKEFISESESEDAETNSARSNAMEEDEFLGQPDNSDEDDHSMYVHSYF